MFYLNCFREKAKLQADSQKYAKMIAEIRVTCMSGGVMGNTFDPYGFNQLPALKECVRDLKEKYGFYNPNEERSKEWEKNELVFHF